MNSKNAVLTALLLFFITLEVLVALDYGSKQKDMREKRVSVYTAILEFQNQIGYVGLIHNFKNAILRPEDSNYRYDAFENYRKATILLDKIEEQGQLILGHLKMEAARDMLTAYKDRLSLLPELTEKNMTVREVDQHLRYNDEPSRVEIKSVFESISLALESEMSDILHHSLKIGFIVLIALLFTLVAIIRFFFQDQQKALIRSNALNIKMEGHKADMLRSQAILLSMMQDVEKEKRQGTILNKQLMNKNREMEQFIYTVSHDLKSPLVTIGAFSQKLKLELVDALTEKQRHRLDRIMQNVNNMEMLLTDLLDLSRIVQQAITTAKIDVKTVVEQQCIVLEEAIQESSAEIDFTEILHTVNANERLLSQGLLNLLSNAIRYREPSHPLIIKVFTTQTATSTLIHVKDNGIGIDPKYQALIFTIFEKLSTTKGTGVGLTIVKTIMEKHHGKVLIDSTLGEGCCFTLEFPNIIKD
jgi:signal transduction histidine kinase